MKKSLFIDTCVFFDCAEKDSLRTIINHARNLDFSIKTSITVIGEFIDQIRDYPDRIQHTHTFYGLIEAWEVDVYYPNIPVSVICFRLGDEGLDYRMENTDRVHLGYAIAYRCDYLVTSDKNLIKYRIPKVLENAGFFKPETLTLEEFKGRL